MTHDESSKEPALSKFVVHVHIKVQEYVFNKPISYLSIQNKLI